MSFKSLCSNNTSIPSLNVSNATTVVLSNFDASNENVTFTVPLTVFSPSFAAGVVNFFVAVTSFPFASTIALPVALSTNVPSTTQEVFGFIFSYVTVSTSFVFLSAFAMCSFVFVSTSVV